MPSERTEHRDTERALTEVYDYISPGTNEGISFSLSRLTDDLFTDSFLAGGDISLFTPSGRRGSIRSQLSNGWLLSSTGASPTQFPVELTVDLSSGTGSGDWTLPDGTARLRPSSCSTSRPLAGRKARCSCSPARPVATTGPTASRCC